ncbi:hypothetical protein KFK09_023535 [Dendrobium nobile]|uniref:Uncharacterized protein n=1 Tax=Dendrobium nobile TaxID=94219 RepID=A0A8T3ABB3_DENNO|nr:hypothetical protein KFK09_023535 [Dendrobium nobile]
MSKPTNYQPKILARVKDLSEVPNSFCRIVFASGFAADNLPETCSMNKKNSLCSFETDFYNMHTKVSILYTFKHKSLIKTIIKY